MNYVQYSDMENKTKLIRLRQLTKEQRENICDNYKMGMSCFNECPMRFLVGRSSICLKDLLRVSDIDVSLRVEEWLL